MGVEGGRYIIILILDSSTFHFFLLGFTSSLPSIIDVECLTMVMYNGVQYNKGSQITHLR